MTAQNAFHFLPWNRYCMYTLGMEEKEKVSAGRREMDAKRNYEASSPATLNPFHILSFYAFLWTPLVENYIFGDLKSPLMHFSGLAVPFCKGVSWRGRGRKEANLKKRKNKKTWGKGKHVLLTSHLVHQDAWGNDAPILREELLQFFLSHGFWQATDVQICISDGGGAWTGIGNLQADTGHMTITTIFWHMK